MALRHTALAAYLVLAANLPVAPAQGQTVQASADVKSSTFEKAWLAYQLASYGRETKDPRALVLAARILNRLPMVEAIGDAGIGQPSKAAVLELLEEAEGLAAGDSQVQSQIDLEKTAAASGVQSRGITRSAFGTGLLRAAKPIGPGASYAFQVTAKGGELLRVGAIGDRSTTLSIRLRDSAGGELCASAETGWTPVCSVTPRAAGDFQVRVQNNGTAPTVAIILSN